MKEVKNRGYFGEYILLQINDVLAVNNDYFLFKNHNYFQGGCVLRVIYLIVS